MIRELLVQQFRFLVFKDVAFSLHSRLWAYLIYVFLIAWIVGIGRYWDHPDAYLWQYAGLGSVFYVLALSSFLYIVIKPLKPHRWSYSMVLVFVGFTSLPALLYAIPVERFLTLERARSINAVFLAVVAFWRIALYVRFLEKGAGLGHFGVFVATLLPLSAIVVTLAALNFEHVVFDLMAGIREESESPNDLAYSVVFFLSIFAYIAFPITVICYLIEIFRQRKK